MTAGMSAVAGQLAAGRLVLAEGRERRTYRVDPPLVIEARHGDGMWEVTEVRIERAHLGNLDDQVTTAVDGWGRRRKGDGTLDKRGREYWVSLPTWVGDQLREVVSWG
jgi:hypothetical protein